MKIILTRELCILKNIEDEGIRKSTFEELKKAINQLPEIQKRRIKKYYFEEKTEQQIAEEEHTTHQSVHIALERAKEKLKEILKKKKKLAILLDKC